MKVILKLNKRQVDTLISGLYDGALYEESFAEVNASSTKEHKKAKRNAVKYFELRSEIIDQTRPKTESKK